MQNYKMRTVSSSTYARYSSLITNYVIDEIGSMNIANIQSTHIQKIYNRCLDENLSTSTVMHIHTIINQSFVEAISQKMISENPATSTTIPVSRRKEIKVLTRHQQEKLLASLKNDAMGVLIKLAIATGARLGELLGLKWENIDFKKRELHIVNGLAKSFCIDEITHQAHYASYKISNLKTQSSLRIIPLMQSMIEILKDYKASNPSETMVFTSTTGNYMDESNVRKKYKKILADAGIPYVKFHALRHTFATRILEANVHPKVAQELLGHSSASTTLNIYSHVLSTEKRKAIAKMENMIK